MKTTATSLVLFLLVFGHMAARGQSLEEIGRMHDQAKAAIRTGRISFTLEREWSPAVIEQGQQNRLRGLAKAEFERRLEIETLRTNGSFEVDYVFDLDAGLEFEHVTDSRDFDKLVSDGSISPDHRQYLSKTIARSFFASPAKGSTPAGTVRTYETDHNTLTITRSDFPERPLCRPGKKLEWGFVQYNPPDPDWSVTIEPLAEDPGILLVSVRKTDGTRSAEVVLDGSFGYRIREWRLFRNNVLECEFVAQYMNVGDYVFPSSFEETWYESNGTPVMREKFTFTSAELNVPIDPSEFEIEVPTDAVVRRDVELWETRPQVVRNVEDEVAAALAEEPTEERDAEAAVETPVASAPSAKEVPKPGVAAPAESWSWSKTGLMLIIAGAAVLALVIALKRRP